MLGGLSQSDCLIIHIHIVPSKPHLSLRLTGKQAPGVFVADIARGEIVKVG